VVQDERDRRIAKLEEEVADLRTVVKALLADNARLREENAQLRAENVQFRAEVEELRARLNQNSSNSSKPPSSDSPADRDARRDKTPSGKRRGGQPGHKGSRRELLTPTKPPVDCFPDSCRRCDKHLPRRPDPDPIRHQTVDLPPITPVVSEWRLHRVGCSDCGAITCGTLPAGVPAGMCAPGLMALIGLLTGDYNMSRRRAVGLLGDVLGIDISLGALSEAEDKVSDALAAPVAEARDHVADQPIKHSDATGWRQGGQARTLWTIATAALTVFFIVPDGGMARLRGLFAKIKGILVSDRGTQFGFWAMDKRQICWAHLIRRFASFAERSGPAGELGKNLLVLAQTMMHCWHRVRDGTMSRASFQQVMKSLGAVIERHLEDGVRLGIRGVSGSCADILEHRQALWTFVRIAGVDPTNNLAERDLRAFVLWRKRSFGSQSDRGSRFAERIMTATHTLRKQKRHVLSYLTQACSAALRGQPAPSLVTPDP
jgi:transposase